MSEFIPLSDDEDKYIDYDVETGVNRFEKKIYKEIKYTLAYAKEEEEYYLFDLKRKRKGGISHRQAEIPRTRFSICDDPYYCNIF